MKNTTIEKLFYAIVALMVVAMFCFMFALTSCTKEEFDTQNEYEEQQNTGFVVVTMQGSNDVMQIEKFSVNATGFYNFGLTISLFKGDDWYCDLFVNTKYATYEMQIPNVYEIQSADVTLRPSQRMCPRYVSCLDEYRGICKGKIDYTKSYNRVEWFYAKFEFMADDGIYYYVEIKIGDTKH